MKALLTGAGGMLAHALHERLLAGSHDIVAVTRQQLDVTDAQRVHDVVATAKPDVVLHCAAFTRVDDAEREEAAAMRINGEGAYHVARACRAIGARFVYPSSDYVFDGTATAPYLPTAPTNPLSAYGRSKLAGEQAAVAAGDYLIVRTSWLYGHHGRHFVCTIARRGRERAPLRVVNDQRGSPTWTRDAADLTITLLERAAPAGIYHITNSGDTTWFDFAVDILHFAGLSTDIAPTTTEAFVRSMAGPVAPRPAYSVLDCSSTYAITGVAPHWRDALRDAIAARVDAC